jgi:hypothetical protein
MSRPTKFEDDGIETSRKLPDSVHSKAEMAKQQTWQKLPEMVAEIPKSLKNQGKCPDCSRTKPASAGRPALAGASRRPKPDWS